MDQLTEAFESEEWKEASRSLRSQTTEKLEELLRSIIRLTQPDIFIEVGAFEAAFSKQMKSLYPAAPVIAAEANPVVFHHFEQSAKAAAIEYQNVAVTDAHGLVEIFVPSKISGRDLPTLQRMTSLQEVSFKNSASTKVVVQGVTLDDLTHRYKFRAACLWIDCEGRISNVLRGAHKSLQVTAIVYAELESSPVWKDQSLASDIIEQLASLGFAMVARDCQSSFQFNALFVRRSLIDENPNITKLSLAYNDAALDLLPNTRKQFGLDVADLLRKSAPDFDFQQVANMGQERGLLTLKEADLVVTRASIPHWLAGAWGAPDLKPTSEANVFVLQGPTHHKLNAPPKTNSQSPMAAHLAARTVSSPKITLTHGKAARHYVRNFARVSWNNKQFFPEMTNQGAINLVPYLEKSAARHLPGKTFIAVVEGSVVYTHWLLDTLPRLLIFRETHGSLDQFDWFLFATVNQGFHKATLDLLEIPPTKVLTRQQHGLLFETEEFTYISAPRRDCVASPSLYTSVRSLFAPSREVTPQGKRLYLTRATATRRRIVNEPEMRAYLETEGFETVRMEDLSIPEAANLIGSAELIVAPHGAALANLIFARSGTTIIEIFGAHLSRDYWVISNQIGLHYHAYQAFHPDGSPFTGAYSEKLPFFERNAHDMRVPIGSFSAFLRSTLAL